MNKPIYFLILLLTCRSFTSIAQTNVSGFISTNTTWNLAGSPYIVVGNVLVSHGFTLTVDPGVIVKFNTDKAIQIDGELIAIGTPANRITFTSNQAVPAAGDWAKIHFSDTCVNAVFNSSGSYLSGSILKYCDVQYGGGLGFGQIHIESASPYITHCNIRNSSSDGIHCVGSTCRIDSSSITNCSEYGIYFDMYFTTSNILSITDDSLLNNSNGGILFGNPNTNNSFPFQIKRNVFISNLMNGAIITHDGYGVDGAIISENYFLNNTSQGTLAGTVAISGFNLTITCNRFINNQVGDKGTLYIIDWDINNPTSNITKNVFDGNTSNAGVSGLYYHVNNQPLAGEKMNIINNLFINNIAVSGTTCYFSGLPIAYYNGLFYIANNSFINNQGISAISLNSDPNQNNNTLRYAHIKNNNLINPGVQYEIENNIPYGDPNIYADSNYWGSTSTQHVDSVIYDYFDFANQTVVYYLPIRPFPAMVDTTCAFFSSGIDNNEQPVASFILFPNPVKTHFTIMSEKLIDKGVVEIYNIIGEKVFEENIYHTSSKEINLNNISSGIYFVKVFNGEKSYCKKIIVEQD